MNEPGDPDAPHSMDPKRPVSPQGEPQDVHHDDDLIGFCTPASLVGRTRATPPAPEAEASFAAEPEAEPEPDLPFVEPFPERLQAAPFEPLAAALPTPPPPAPGDDTPAWARETPEAERPQSRFGRREDPPAEVEGAMGLYTIYALMLIAVPTFGVAAALALLSVFGREGPRSEPAASHFLYQKRTLFVAAGLAVLGGVLIALGLGVFVLFVLAVWLIARGAFGVLRLKADRPIAKPRSWLF